ncbi:MAG: hypothetical protein GX889_11670 [Clostridiales bacterium]|nr:hypothetical protein [Clostridiales bacterium]
MKTKVKKLLILGAGGHGKVVAEIASLMKQWDEIAFLDDNKELKQVNGYREGINNSKKDTMPYFTGRISKNN